MKWATNLAGLTLISSSIFLMSGGDTGIAEVQPTLETEEKALVKSSTLLAQANQSSVGGGEQNTTKPLVKSSAPKRHRINLAVTDMGDVKVTQGDTVEAGAILSDKTAQRERLESRRSQLELAITQMSLPMPELKELPSPNFQQELIAVERAKTEVNRAKAKTNDSRFLDPQLSAIHDPEVQEEITKAEINLSLAIARLDAARTRYQNQQYQHSLEIAQHQTNIQRQQYQLAGLTAQLEETEKQLEELSIVRSPYRGKIRRVKITGQTDRTINLEVTIDVQD